MTEDDKKRLLDLAQLNPDVNPHVIKALYHRGVNTQEKINEFFNNDLSKIGSAREFSGCDVMIDELVRIKENDELLVIMSDYDCDGSCGSSISYLALTEMGYRVHHHVNTREVGYGLKVESVNIIKQLYPEVTAILTVDNGITSFEAVDYANQLGIKVLITDHHKSEGGNLPNAKAIVNPNKFGCTSKTKNNCGAIIAWKVMLELSKVLGRDDLKDFMYDLLDLGAIATVADQMTLLGDNRLIVRHGLKLLNRRSRFSLAVIMDAAGIQEVTAETIGFYIGPLINAVNRMGADVNVLIKTLVSDYDNKQDIQNFANLMVSLNNLRKSETSEALEKIYSEIDVKIEEALFRGEPNPLDNVLIVYNETLPEGIVGIIASNLMERYSRPAVVLTKTKDGIIKGSARSISPLNIKSLFDEISDVFLSYGGHEFSAGLSFKDYNDFLLFKIKVYEKTADINPNDFNKLVYVDVILHGKLNDLNVCTMFDCMEPFGNGFVKPRFMYRDFTVDWVNTNFNKAKSPYVGKDGKTLRLVDANKLTAIMFKYADKFKALGEPNVLNMIGKPIINEFKGFRSIQFQVEEDYIIRVK